MLTDTTFQGTALALNFAGDALPDRVQLLPAGQTIKGYDGRSWSLPDPARLVQAFNAGKRRPIDIEHATQKLAPNGHPAPAVGWIEKLEAAADGVWGQVAWNTQGQQLIAGRAYSYLSPVFRFDATGRIHSLVSAGLTNEPNLELVALNRTDTSIEETDMDANVLEALGLKPTSTAADALTAIATLKEARDIALNRAQTPDPDKFVPKADHQLALNRIATFETAEKARTDAEITAAVDEAVAAGKIAPATKDYHLATCRAEGGFDRFKTMIATAPVLLSPSGIDKSAPTPSGDKAAYLALNSRQQVAFISTKAHDLVAAEKAKGVEIELGVAINRVMETLK